ncbi:hypothetical protein [Candidatus Poriferisocius sp.]|uniref:hypothetical protein n=1 Tax=Candidatus Poriferisocius sp. TaxID=3101276 RepID=UPI003B525C0A
MLAVVTATIIVTAARHMAVTTFPLTGEGRIGALTGSVAVVFGALLVLFLLLAVGTYDYKRLSHLVEAGKQIGDRGDNE